MNIYIQVFYRLEYSKRAWAIDCRIMANFPNSSRNIYAINGTDTDEVYFVFFFNKLLDNELVASRCCRKCFIDIFFGSSKYVYQIFLLYCYWPASLILGMKQ